jgi:SAM-dependent methyltransferase
VSSTEPNQNERRRWNDCAWTAAWTKRELLTTAVTEVLLGRIGLQPGDTVLDIGTGGGVAALAAARIVGDGTVVGADLSVPLIEIARQRAEARGVTNVSFVVADVQHEALAAGPFDTAISQFGVMCFDEPETAFGKIRQQVISGGRLGFACWRAPELNPWNAGPALAEIVVRPPSPPDKSPTGPFSLADPQHTIALLETSGWRDINRTEHELLVTVDRDAIVDDEALRFYGVPTDSFVAAWRIVERQLAPITRVDGRIDAPLAFQIFTASA